MPATIKAGKDKPDTGTAKALVLEHLSLGKSVVDATKHVGRTRQAFYDWCRTDEVFAGRAKSIQERVRDNGGAAIDDSEERRPSRFAPWRKKFFGFDTFPHQAEMVEAFESAPPGSVTMVILPPEAGKTTVVEDFITKLVCENPNTRCAVISEGASLAEKILGRIKNRLEDDITNADLHREYGPFHSRERAIARTWNAGAIKLLGARGGERDYTVEARGSNSKIYGARYDWVFLDDIQSVLSINETPKLLAKYFQDWRTRPGKAGRIIITGTRVGLGDFYGELKKALGDRLRVILIPAIIKEDEEGEPCEPHSYFPASYRNAAGEMVLRDNEPDESEGLTRMVSEAGEPLGWTLGELDERRAQVTDAVFDLVYLMETSGSVLVAFIEEEIRRCSDPERAPGPPHKGFGPIFSIDPALAGVAGIFIASYDYEHLYCEKVFGLERVGRFEAILDFIEPLMNLHRPSYLVIEANTLQGGWARDERLQKMARAVGCTILEHQTRGNKWDQIVGLKSMSAAFKRGEIRIPTGGKLGELDGAAMFEPLIQQLINWREDPTHKRRNKQDLMDALWFAWVWWLNMRHTLVTSTKQMKRQGLPGYTGRGGLPGYGSRVA